MRAAALILVALTLVPMVPLWVLSPGLSMAYGSLLGVVLLMLSVEVRA